MRHWLKGDSAMKRVLVVLGMAAAMPAWGAVSLQDVNLQVEPIVGYEKAFKATPTPHTNLRFMYGLRAVAGYSILSGELEATRASDSEAYPEDLKVIDETSDKIKLGIRSSVERSFGSAFLRAGGQAQRLSRTETVASISSKVQDPLSIDPYAGLGLELGGNLFRVTGAATVVFRNTSDWRQNEIETTFGVRIGR
jgi:hypothetical protein